MMTSNFEHRKIKKMNRKDLEKQDELIIVKKKEEKKSKQKTSPKLDLNA